MAALLCSLCLSDHLRPETGTATATPLAYFIQAVAAAEGTAGVAVDRVQVKSESESKSRIQKLFSGILLMRRLSGPLGLWSLVSGIWLSLFMGLH